MTRSRLLNVRVSDEQRDRWQAEADARGLSLSQYVKDSVEAAATSEPEATGGDLLEGHADGQIEGQAALEPPSEAGPEGQPEGHAEPVSTTGGPMVGPDWKPTSEAMREKILAQRDRPAGYTDDEWISMTPLARAARAAEASRR